MSDSSKPLLLWGQVASEGIAAGSAHVLDWLIPQVPHSVLPPEAWERELEGFYAALQQARGQLEDTRARTADALGPVEARIFDPQLLMLDDPAVVDGTARYIRHNRFAAPRAFDLRMLELGVLWSGTSHPMVLDRLNDLADLRRRVLGQLLHVSREQNLEEEARGKVVVATDLTPSLLLRLMRAGVAALATEEGTRSSHWAILARSARIPAVAALSGLTGVVSRGCSIILDGRRGRVTVNPDGEAVRWARRRRSSLDAWERKALAAPGEEIATADGFSVALMANLDLPTEAGRARRLGACGVGLLRTEFLAVGRRQVPDEEEQLESYREVIDAFVGLPVHVRTFDLGGDKVPSFLDMRGETNPLLGTRAVRLWLSEPDLHMPQVRALVRASAHGDLRILVPLVTTVAELDAVRALVREAQDQLVVQGLRVPDEIPIGVMVETPAAALIASDLARVADFISIGTNDLAQHTLAVDRANTRMTPLFDEFHPAVLRQIANVVRVGQEQGIEVSVCGEMASRPASAALLLGLGVGSLSVSWPALPEVRELVKRCRMQDLRQAADVAVRAHSGQEARQAAREALGGWDRGAGPNGHVFPPPAM